MAIAQRLQERLVARRRAAHDQGPDPGVMRQHLQHRVDEDVRALLAADASEAADVKPSDRPSACRSARWSAGGPNAVASMPCRITREGRRR